MYCSELQAQIQAVAVETVQVKGMAYVVLAADKDLHGYVVLPVSIELPAAIGQVRQRKPILGYSQWYDARVYGGHSPDAWLRIPSCCGYR